MGRVEAVLYYHLTLLLRYADHVTDKVTTRRLFSFRCFHLFLFRVCFSLLLFLPTRRFLSVLGTPAHATRVDQIQGRGRDDPHPRHECACPADANAFDHWRPKGGGASAHETPEQVAGRRSRGRALAVGVDDERVERAEGTRGEVAEEEEQDKRRRQRSLVLHDPGVGDGRDGADD